MFGLSRRERIVGVIASACGKQVVRMQRELRSMYRANPDNVDKEKIKLIFDMYFQCVELDVLDHFVKKYPEHEHAFHRRIDYWHTQTKGVVLAGHLFEAIYSTITGKSANPYYCNQLNKWQEDSVLKALGDMSYR